MDFSKDLLSWYDAHARALPWRGEKDPYRVWLSEIMLQQTQTQTVKGYYARFLERFPDVFALAAADEEAVLKLWEGLGYYSRARNLHACAQKIVDEYGGRFPESAAELRRLPGIGDYTAGAIASIAFGKPEPAVDGNVLRVLARLERSGENVGSEKVKAAFREQLRAIYPADRPGEFTSALMELGETVCVPGTPSCPLCPLAGLCRAHAHREETLYPVLPEKKPRRIEKRRVLLLRCGDAVAVRRRPEKGLLAGLWELPNDLESDPPAGGIFCGEAVHVFSHVEWHMRGYLVDCETRRPGFVWVTGAERRALAFPTAFRYYIQQLEEMGL